MTPYGSLEDALAYHAALGNEAWADSDVTDAQRTAALLRGSRALDGRYGKLFAGFKKVASQERAFPRTGGYDYCSDSQLLDGEVPLAIQQAAYELALVELTSPGSTTPTINLGRLTKSEAVDGAASRSFFSPAEMSFLGDVLDGFRPTLTTVADLVSCYTRPSPGRWVATVV